MNVSERAAVWEHLLHRSLCDIQPLSGGRNSRTWQLTDAQGQHFVGKEYFRSSADSRDRLATEWTALNFLHQHGLYCAPHPLACDGTYSRAVYSFVAGESPAPYGEEEDALRPVADFVCQLYDIRAAAQAAFLPRASEACFSFPEIAEQLQKRFQPLLGLEGASSVQRDCLAFLRQKLVPQLELCLCTARARMAQFAQMGLEIHSVLPLSASMPSPSDLGFHNAIRQADGTLCFVDFEYFGMDDPVKLLTDLCVHPAMSLTTAQKKFFLEHILQYIKAQDTSVRARLQVYAPLWRLKWCAIVLNEFVPRERARRDFAGISPPVREQLLYRQLAKAEKLLEEDDHDLFCTYSL